MSHDVGKSDSGAIVATWMPQCAAIPIQEVGRWARRALLNGAVECRRSQPRFPHLMLWTTDAIHLANTLLHALADGEDRIRVALALPGRDEASRHAGDVFLTTLQAGLPVQAWESQAIQDRQRRHLADASHLG